MKQGKELIMSLKEAGIDVEEIVVRKNGILCNGLKVINGEGRVCPVIYYSPDETLSELIQKIRYAVENTPDVNLAVITNKDYLKENAYLVLQKKGEWYEDEETIRRDYLNLEVALRIKIQMGDDEGSIKASTTLLNAAGMTEEELWNAAEENTKASIISFTMEEALGIPGPLVEEMGEIPFSIFTTWTRANGAIALYFPEIFRDFCKKHSIDRTLIIPSSTEEVIISRSTGIDPRTAALMVREVNDTVVNPLLQLPPVVYEYHLDTDEILIAGTAELY